MVDETRVYALLRSIQADLAFLHRESEADPARRADEARPADHGDLDALVGAVLRWLGT